MKTGFESKKSFTTNEFQVPISSGIHSISDEIEMTGIIIGVFSDPHEGSN
jgi:hypothetical protein